MSGVVNQYAGAFAFSAQRVRGARGRGDADAELDDGAGEIIRRKLAGSGRFGDPQAAQAAVISEGMTKS